MTDLNDVSCANVACDPATATGWDGHDAAPADLIDLVTADPTGDRRVVVVRCKRITGQVDLRWRQLKQPLRLERCRVEGDLLLVDAEAQELTIVDSVVTGQVNATRVEVTGCFTISGSSLEGGVLLTGARIGGDLKCDDSELLPPQAGGAALDGRGLDVKGDLQLGPAVRSAQVSLNAAQVGRDLRFDGSRFHDDLRSAIDASGITVKGAVSLGVAFDDTGHARRDPCGEPLRCVVEGGIDLRGASIGGDLSCDGARLSPRAGQAAFQCDGLRDVGDVALGAATDPDGDPVRDSRQAPVRFECDGEVRLVLAKLRGQLRASGGRFHNEGAHALSADGMTAADIVLSAAEADGVVIRTADAEPLRFHALGEVRLLGVVVVGQVQCRGGHFENGGSPEKVALNLNGAVIGDQVFLSAYPTQGAEPVPFTATGVVRMRNATCRALRCNGGRFSNPGGVALDASKMQVARNFEWSGVEVQGGVDLRAAAVGLLEDDAEAWPGNVYLAGFTYALATPDDGGTELTVQQRIDWLSRQKTYRSEPYRHLVSVYRGRGDDRSARKIAMAQFNEQLARKDSGLKRRTWWWRWVLRLTVGHGYEPWRALYWAAALWLLGWLWVNAAVHADRMVPTKAALATSASTPDPAGVLKPSNCSQRSYPCLSPPIYAAELVFPIVKLDQRDNWRPNGSRWFRAMVPVLVAFGWALTTFVVAGFSSLVRRE